MYLVPLSKCNVIAFTLHLRGGVKGSIVISLYLGFSHVLYICTPMGLNTKGSILPFLIRNSFHALIVAFMESESWHQYWWCRNALLTSSGNFASWISQSSPYCSFGASKLFKIYSLLTLYFIVVYDVTKRESFSNLADVWTQEIEANSTNKDCIKMLVGNKVDKVPSLLENWLLFAFLEKLWSDL